MKPQKPESEIEATDQITCREAGRQRLLVSLRHVAAPDAEERLRHATSLLLKAATKNTPNHQGEHKARGIN